MNPKTNPDYSEITEVPGLKASKDQLDKACHRYNLARSYSDNKDVLEIACGSGMGLGYLASVAKSVTGGDINEINLSFAEKQYAKNEKIKVLKIDAHNLPFPDDSFDVVVLFEALYYLNNPDKFISESHRVLRKNGVLIIGTVNCEWKDFHISPFSVKYYSAKELNKLLQEKFNNITVLGAFQVEKGLKASVFSFIKRTAMNFNLIPGGLKARAYLKRIFMGELVNLPAELTDDGRTIQPSYPVNTNNVCSEYKILYAVGLK
jgi:ubiquinone/menaquinone biosynthesis C-methylase UbiE